MPKNERVIQVCQNGHLINYDYVGKPDDNKKYCPRCGTKTLANCPNCQSPLTDDLGYMTFKAPNYCNNCGNPFPWTSNRIDASKKIIHDSKMLSDDEKGIWDSNVNDLINDTPLTNSSASNVKVIINKVGPQVASMLREVLVDILSETAMKIIFPEK